MIYFKIPQYNKLNRYSSIEEAIKDNKEKFPNNHYFRFIIKKEDENDGIYEVTKVYRNINKNPYKITKLYEDPIDRSFMGIFGTKNSSRGCIQNKILLSFWITRFKKGDYISYAWKQLNLNDFFNLVIDNVNHRPVEGVKGKVVLKIKNNSYVFYSNKYSSYYNGSGGNPIIAQCADFKCIRVIDTKTNKPVVLKASKVFIDVLKTNKVVIGDSAVIYCAEEFQRRWATSNSELLSNLELHVDKDFKGIYTSKRQDGNFHSCMNDKGQHVFYEKCVNASAAYLVDTNTNLMKARCIIYHDVTTASDSSKKLNYAERQYSQEQNDLYKSILIDKLIQGNYIDIYKTVGAGCRDVNAILDTEGHQIKDSHIQIPMHITSDDTVSFLDTFRYYYDSKHIGSNYLIDCTSRYREMDQTHPHF